MNDVGPEHFRTTAGGFCVRVMGAYGSEGVWTAEGQEALVEDLPIDRALADRLADWQEAFDSVDDQIDDGDIPAEIAATAWAALAEEGLLIARSIKRALPEWTVLYVDPALALEEGAEAAAAEIDASEVARGV
ncbi:hypothetical protein GCM10007036_32810 [Alsobacter metallidurans]|uniref:Uncharacterized protein n=1 Tax=Alsobacter metallidurans TaxID=340221 RepID=A0A917IA96_9HYPH|nr:hypothetical protein [Alsobacter metallidurans]GGH25587.1 hypothetical protein GCM10007036_32810 [Alsobacter metallidurans]